jgi:hypothetical protein
MRVNSLPVILPVFLYDRELLLSWTPKKKVFFFHRRRTILPVQEESSFGWDSESDAFVHPSRDDEESRKEICFQVESFQEFGVRVEAGRQVAARLLPNRTAATPRRGHK